MTQKVFRKHTPALFYFFLLITLSTELLSLKIDFGGGMTKITICCFYALILIVSKTHENKKISRDYFISEMCRLDNTKTRGTRVFLITVVTCNLFWNIHLLFFTFCLRFSFLLQFWKQKKNVLKSKWILKMWWRLSSKAFAFIHSHLSSWEPWVTQLLSRFACGSVCGKSTHSSSLLSTLSWTLLACMDGMWDSSSTTSSMRTWVWSHWSTVILAASFSTCHLKHRLGFW